MSIPEILRRLRISENLKQTDIAKELDVVQSYSAYENNRELSYDLRSSSPIVLMSPFDYLSEGLNWWNTAEEISLKCDSGPMRTALRMCCLSVFTVKLRFALKSPFLHKEKCGLMRVQVSLFCFDEKIRDDVAFNEV